jgi:6-phosphogluconate dehydrogenase
MNEPSTLASIGLIGLGAMGANLGLNLAEHGITVVGYDQDPDTVARFSHTAQTQGIKPERLQVYSDMAAFLAALPQPRIILALVPAGDPVDKVIGQLSASLASGDTFIDGGNSHFQDTERRIRALAKRNIHLVGLGVSGGHAGARHGPSLMPGGNPAVWEPLRPVLEAVAARVNGESCVAWLGQGAAGHYVKMVHNGIEYALMQLIAESYDLMHRGLGLNHEEMHPLYHHWAQSPMGGFLLEITAAILQQRDSLGEGYLLCKILDTARQKGTGQWTSQESLTLQIPTPLINAAVTQRVLSAAKADRQQVSQYFEGPVELTPVDHEPFLTQLGKALQGAMQLAYAQGLHQLHAASQHYHYDLSLERVTAVWRGGCIIRSQLLEDLRRVYQRQPQQSNPLLDPDYAATLTQVQADLRAVSCVAAYWGIPAPGFMAGLSYYDTYRSAWLPANLIQAQRDYFGAHGFERTDREGRFHGEWDEG